MTQVNAALLAAGSQHMRRSRRNQNRDSPVSSRPPILHAERRYGDIRRRHRRGRIKLASINVSIAHEGKTAYLEHARVVQPPPNDSKCACRVVGPRRQRDRIKIAPVKLKIEHLNDKRGKNGERTHLGRENTTQSPRNAPKRRYRVIGLIRRRRQRNRIKIEPVKLKIECLNDKKTQELETTHLGQAQLAQPLLNTSKCCWEVHRSRCPRGRIKIEPTNVSRTREDRNTYLKCVNTIRSTRRPKKVYQKV